MDNPHTWSFCSQTSPVLESGLLISWLKGCLFVQIAALPEDPSAKPQAADDAEEVLWVPVLKMKAFSGTVLSMLLYIHFLKNFLKSANTDGTFAEQKRV